MSSRFGYLTHEMVTLRELANELKSSKPHTQAHTQNQPSLISPHGADKGGGVWSNRNASKNTDQMASEIANYMQFNTNQGNVEPLATLGEVMGS